MPTIHYCPECWKEIGEQDACPACGANLKQLAEDSYEEKLIRALRHPEPTVPVRAAMILGELRSAAAVADLIETVSNTEDPYLQESAVLALGAIGDPKATACLKHLRRTGALRVRAAAEHALKLIAANTSLENDNLSS